MQRTSGIGDSIYGGNKLMWQEQGTVGRPQLLADRATGQVQSWESATEEDKRTGQGQAGKVISSSDMGFHIEIVDPIQTARR